MPTRQPLVAALIAISFVAAVIAVPPSAAAAEPGGAAAAAPANLALVATASTSYVSGHETIRALNNGSSPANSDDKRQGAYGNWPRNGTQWVQYDWSQPIATDKIEVYWFDDQQGVRLPTACRLKYWNGERFVAVEGAKGLGLAANRFNPTTFSEVRTPRLRLEMDSAGQFSTGILQWRVYDSGRSPNFPPRVEAGPDRTVVLPGKTYLSGRVQDDGKPRATPQVTWSKESGPGTVRFDDATQAATAAALSAPGEYVLRLTADNGQLSGSDTLRVSVLPPPPAVPLTPIYSKTYKIHSPLWSQRVKKLIVNWIPHCCRMIAEAKLPEGGLENFVQAGNKLAGRPFKPQRGAVFANAWVYNTVEAMCLALMVDPQGDPEIIAAQKALRDTLDDWIPKILGAQEPDGYIQTCYTLGGLRRWTNRHDHEGYQAGYFIEAAIAHRLLTGRSDDPLFRAAVRLADCWCENIGPPPKRRWFEGHEELEQALVRLARAEGGDCPNFRPTKMGLSPSRDKGTGTFFGLEGPKNEPVPEGPGRGRRYLELAKFLLDSRGGGDQYDQSHLPVTRQYEAVGHAVRAAYCYSGMAAVALETGDPDYRSAAVSLADNLVHKKYYLTGGLGSGETPEGFGPNYSLPNNAYCESCANCGELFFQHKLNLMFHDARYAERYEETLFNAILGDVDLEACNFTYTNALDSAEKRYPWHGCPCCVGNIPRTLLMLPTWMYAQAADGLYVNLYIGSTVTLENTRGGDVCIEQATDYPWSGKVSIIVHTSRCFTIRLRVPDRNTSRLYTGTPPCAGILSLAVNGQPATPRIEAGYAAIARQWRAGDRIDLLLPMPVERVKADARVAADVGRVALRRGPLVYNIESVDENLDLVLPADSALTPQWEPGLLGGVIVIRGTFRNAAPLVAIPNYARNNRGGRSLVWIKDQ